MELLAPLDVLLRRAGAVLSTAMDEQVRSTSGRPGRARRVREGRRPGGRSELCRARARGRRPRSLRRSAPRLAGHAVSPGALLYAGSAWSCGTRPALDRLVGSEHRVPAARPPARGGAPLRDDDRARRVDRLAASGSFRRNRTRCSGRSERSASPAIRARSTFWAPVDRRIPGSWLSIRSRRARAGSAPAPGDAWLAIEARYAHSGSAASDRTPASRYALLERTRPPTLPHA